MKFKLDTEWWRFYNKGGFIGKNTNYYAYGEERLDIERFLFQFINYRPSSKKIDELYGQEVLNKIEFWTAAFIKREERYGEFKDER